MVGTAEVESRFEAFSTGDLTPFIGREHEINLVKDRWQHAIKGDGQVVLLCGEPGIGKSRITLTTRDQIVSDDFTRVRYQCSPYYRSSALYPVIEHLQRAAGFIEGDSDSARLDKLECLLAVNDPHGSQTVAILAALLSISSKGRYPVLDLDPKVLRERTLDALLSGLESLTRRQPLFILVEDVHWADPTTLVLLNSMVEQIRGWTALLMVTFRPEFDPPWSGEAHVSLLSLNRLDRGQCESMISMLTGGKAVPREIVEQIALKTDGVPLFVEELTRTILESELLTEEQDSYVLSGSMQPFAIPTTLQDSLMARLDQLDDAKTLAQIGAAIGREFSQALLAAAGGFEPDAITPALDRASSGQGLSFGTAAECGRTTYSNTHWCRMPPITACSRVADMRCTATSQRHCCNISLMWHAANQSCLRSTTGRMRTAKHYFEHCVLLARQHGFPKTAAANLSMRGFSRAYLLELREAWQDGTDAIMLAKEAGHPPGHSFSDTS